MKKFLLATTVLVAAGCSSQEPAPVVGGFFKDDYRVVEEAQIMPVATPQVSVNQTETVSTSGYRVAQMQDIEPAAGPMGTLVDKAAAQPKNFGTYRMTQNRDYSSAQTAVASAQNAVNNLQTAAAPSKDIFNIQPAAGPVIEENLMTKTIAAAPTANAQTYHVAKGDTLYSLSRTYRTTVANIMRMNNMTSPQQLIAGDMIMVPNIAVARTQDVFKIQPAAGPAVSQPSAPAAPTVTTVETVKTTTTVTPVIATSGNTHTMAKGDTLYSLAKRYGTKVSTLTSLNAITSPSDISIGRILKLPTTTASTAPSTPINSIEPAAGTTAPKGFNSPDITMVNHSVGKGENLYRIGLKYKVSVIDLMAANDLSVPQDLKAGMQIKVPLTSNQTAVVRQTTTVNQAAARAKGMVWPAKGELLSSFGQKGNGVTHTGVAIKLPENTPVMAAEAGEVIYADSGLKSYGNLVLVRHADGLVTAYAHNNALHVKKGQKVAKGQTIALSGATGNVSTPQLHFEVRRNARAIDPTSVLPKV